MLQFHEILLRKKISEIKTSIHIFAAQASSATIDIVVKPRDSNDVWVRRNLFIDFELMFSRKKIVIIILGAR